MKLESPFPTQSRSAACPHQSAIRPFITVALRFHPYPQRAKRHLTQCKENQLISCSPKRVFQATINVGSLIWRAPNSTFYNELTFGIIPREQSRLKGASCSLTRISSTQLGQCKHGNLPKIPAVSVPHQNPTFCTQAIT
jgi:hypothetical protein